MPRFFNTAGPNDPARHYTLPILSRLPDIRRLIERQHYFVVYAPRQVGKTTTMRALAKELTAEGKFVGVLVSMEAGVGLLKDVGAAERSILSSWRRSVAHDLPPELQPPEFTEDAPGGRIAHALNTWACTSSRPLVVFLDEIDALEGDVLLSVLRQIRDGYRLRPQGFPWSLALIGMRNVRDYKIAANGGDRSHSASPFNIAVQSITLRNFTRDEVRDLYAQHTEETGQAFLPEAVERAFDLSRGQPWLVNALACEITDNLVPDRSHSITQAHVEQAKEVLIQRQDTHLDSLAERLRESRIQAIIEPMLAGEGAENLAPDDIRLAIDLGLVQMSSKGGLEISNPIYREIVLHTLSASPRANLPSIPATWLGAGGKLNKEALLLAFMDFWRQHGEPLLRSAPYHEVAPHLVLMAFLHRVVNGGGTVEREYAIGSGRMDLCVRYGGEVLGIEIKVWKPSRPDPESKGLLQLDGYLAGIGQESGWLIVFDRRPGVAPVEERLSWHEALTPSGRKVVVIRA